MAAFLIEQGMPTEVAAIRHEHVEALLVHLQGLHSASTAANPYRSLRQLFRDTALILVFLDTGAPLAEVAGITLDDLDLYRSGTILVEGEGNRERVVKVGPRTSNALDRYLRVRARDGDREARWLWLGKKGRLSGSGIAQMLRRRSDEAVHPHQFRHTFSHNWLAAGGGEQDLMMLTGWRSRDMLARYGASTAAERARNAHKQLSPGERLLSGQAPHEQGAELHPCFPGR